MSSTAGYTSQDWRFAVLAARSGLEAELGARFGADPVAVLAEFGLAEHSPAELPALCAGLVIEDLDRPDPAGALTASNVCITGNFTEPTEYAAYPGDAEYAEYAGDRGDAAPLATPISTPLVVAFAAARPVAC
ncbi:hypothetical protein ACFVT2_11215 [Streptomyces sp. NPDC058000]|uniref:hypothetical protein n=1 Tax=Streptomyces sp. NPDC058000 TaxID=3346299 RepID=UPI0036E1AF6A